MGLGWDEAGLRVELGREEAAGGGARPPVKHNNLDDHQLLNLLFTMYTLVYITHYTNS